MSSKFASKHLVLRQSSRQQGLPLLLRRLQILRHLSRMQAAF
jgi:hypothetical protein